MSEISQLEQNLLIKKIDKKTVNVQITNNDILMSVVGLKAEVKILKPYLNLLKLAYFFEEILSLVKVKQIILNYFVKH